MKNGTNNESAPLEETYKKLWIVATDGTPGGTYVIHQSQHLDYLQSVDFSMNTKRNDVRLRVTRLKQGQLITDLVPTPHSLQMDEEGQLLTEELNIL